MKVYFKAEDGQESKMLAKSFDMACFLWQLKHNLWKQKYKYNPEQTDPFDVIQYILEVMENEYNINPDDFIN